MEKTSLSRRKRITGIVALVLTVLVAGSARATLPGHISQAEAEWLVAIRAFIVLGWVCSLAAWVFFANQTDEGEGFSLTRHIFPKLRVGEIKQGGTLIILALLFLAMAFYWYEYRPAQIRKVCAKAGEPFVGRMWDSRYKECMIGHGIEQ